MTPQGPVDLAAEARARVERAMRLLERPTQEALEETAAELLAAVARIQQINEEGAKGGPPLKSAIAALRKDLGRVALLLRHAWEFRAAASQQACYSQRGELTAQATLRASWALDG